MLTPAKEPRHLWYSDEQELMNGINMGRLLDGNLVKYTVATQEKIQPSYYQDFIYLGEGTFVKIISPGMNYESD